MSDHCFVAPVALRASQLPKAGTVCTCTVPMLLKAPAGPRVTVMPVTVSVPEDVTNENLSISVAEAPGPIVELLPSVPSPRVVTAGNNQQVPLFPPLVPLVTVISVLDTAQADQLTVVLVTDSVP